MNKAIEKAYEAYPLNEWNHLNHEWNAKRVGFQQGYEQAEKDNELTWKDIEKVCLIAKEVHLFRGFWSENVYQEVLERFLEERKER